MDKTTTILVIEDEDDLRDIILYNLKNESYNTLDTDSGELGLKLAKEHLPDLILLDLMLPKINGLDVCKQLKTDKSTQHIPIIMVSAKGEESDIIIGLELGAEDYVPKPFSPRVLLARIRAVLRRSFSPSKEQALINIDGLSIDVRKHSIHVDGQEISLTKSEFSILQFLVNNRGWVFTRFQIVNAIRGERYVVTERAVDVQVVGLRKKINPYGDLIETVRGIGYKFKE
ncbi:MAG: response regulator [Gammaproteobacteria bacterium]|nr:response regulator [Gammaproteobacteria bacterium]